MSIFARLSRWLRVALRLEPPPLGWALRAQLAREIVELIEPPPPPAPILSVYLAPGPHWIDGDVVDIPEPHDEFGCRLVAWPFAAGVHEIDGQLVIVPPVGGIPVR